MEVVRHYHLAYQGKAILPAIERQLFQENLAELFILKIRIVPIGPCGDKVCVGVIIKFGEILI